MSKDRPLIAVIDDEEPVRNVNSLDPKNREQVISTVRQLLKGNNPGILSTVDQSAFHSRAGWLPCRSMTSKLVHINRRQQPKGWANQGASHRSMDVFQSRLEFRRESERQGRAVLAGLGNDEASMDANY